MKCIFLLAKLRMHWNLKSVVILNYLCLKINLYTNEDLNHKTKKYVNGSDLFLLFLITFSPNTDFMQIICFKNIYIQIPMRRKKISLISWNLKWEFNFFDKRTMFRPMSYYLYKGTPTSSFKSRSRKKSRYSELARKNSLGYLRRHRCAAGLWSITEKCKQASSIQGQRC